MSDHSDSASEGEGDQIRPYGDEHDSSEESAEDDPEELKRIAAGFIDDDDEDEEDDGSPDEEDPEARRRRKKEERRRRKEKKRARRAARAREQAELSEDELDLLNENRGIGSSKRPSKRPRRHSGSVDDDLDLDMGDERAKLKNMFEDDEGMMDEDDDDLGDFIEEDEEPVAGETEEERRQRRREEKLKRREAAKARPEASGVDKAQWDEMQEIFGDGSDYLMALEEEGFDDERNMRDTMPKVELEDVFDPAEIKARRLAAEDQVVQAADRPERHQFINSSLSDNPIPASDLPFPLPELVASYALPKISTRTQYLFLGMGEENSYPPPPPYGSGIPWIPIPRRTELYNQFYQAVVSALDSMFVKQHEVPYLWHYKRDQFALLEDEGRRAVQFLERDELWTLYTLGVRFQSIFSRVEEAKDLFERIKTKRPDPPASTPAPAPTSDENGSDEAAVAAAAAPADPYAAKDTYLFNNLLNSICLQSMEAAADAMDWLEYHYATEVKQVREDEAMMAEVEGKRRLPERVTIKDMRTGAIMELVKAFGINVEQAAETFNDPNSQPAPLSDPTKMPLELADEFAGLDTPFSTPEQALQTAVGILTADLTKNPAFRQQTREFMRECATVTVTPTDRGMSVIDKYHAYFTFKYLSDKPAAAFHETPQWLHILKAEEEGLITIQINAGATQQPGSESATIDSFIGALYSCCKSADYGEVATAWNALRQQICDDAVKKFLVPHSVKWLKEHLKRQAEEFVAERCRMELEYRVNVRPFAPEGVTDGTIPSVLALTNGKGEQRDAVIAVHLDALGNIRSQTKFDSLSDPTEVQAFLSIFRRTGETRKRSNAPTVVVVGGMSVYANRLKTEVASALLRMAADEIGQSPPDEANYMNPEEFQMEQRIYDEKLKPCLVPLVMPSDVTARMYMDSDEGRAEHPNLPANARYALALARYTQNPLNAYAKLGKGLLGVTFMEHHQRLISQDKLLLHLERGLVNSVCAMGLDFWPCVQEPYLRSMLPFVAGLGPRKADALFKATQKHFDFIYNRMSLRDYDVMPITTWENAIGFLTIEADINQLQLEEESPETQPEPLDSTRIHPEHYHMAQKLCQDTLDMDAEDREGMHRSDVVIRLMTDPDREGKLFQLNLDDFAWRQYVGGGANQRHMLGEIVRELIDPRADRRPQFYVPNQWEVLTMLTGETERTVGRAMLVTANVRRYISKGAICTLESGIEAFLDKGYVMEHVVDRIEDVVPLRSSIKAVVIDADPGRLRVSISARPDDVSKGQAFFQPFAPDPYNSTGRAEEAEAAAAAKKRRQTGQVKRIINHPKWHEMKAGQAEQFLASQPRGEVVIRPSSKGPNYLALTIKLDEDIFSHVDVEEIDKPSDYQLGAKLRVAGKYVYNDLDEIVVHYVMPVMRMLEQAERHEKWKPEAELESYLKNTLLAFPNRSMYAFALDSEPKRAGCLKLAFLNKATKDGGKIQYWPVRLLPGAYKLGPAELPGMLELCNAFKLQYSNQLANQGAGGKTPGIRAGRTPAHGGRTPAVGGRTPAPGYAMGIGGKTPMPNQMGGQTPYGQVNPVMGTPLRPGMTPNAYGQSRDPRYGGATPAQAYGGYPPAPPPGAGPPGQGYGMPMPPPGAPPGPPRAGGAPQGMNPERAAMLARQGGNGY